MYHGITLKSNSTCYGSLRFTGRPDGRIFSTSAPRRSWRRGSVPAEEVPGIDFGLDVVQDGIVAVGDEVLAGSVAFHDGLDQVFRHVLIVGYELLGILGQGVMIISRSKSIRSVIQIHLFAYQTNTPNYAWSLRQYC